MDEIIPAKIPRDVVKYINDLSKELHIEDAEGVLGNELELIALVRNCPFLYNKHHTMFKDPRNRVKAWATIASIMRCSENDIKQRWRTLRESYTKTKKAIEHTSDPTVIARLQNWEYFEDMRFLDPYIKHRVKFKISDTQSSFFSTNDESSDEISGPIENRLIQLIHENPLLYDKYTIGFSSASKKEAIWQYIASELGSTVLKCKTRWRTLRERFLKERRDGRRTWRYYDEMSFIEKFCKTRSKKPDSVNCNFQPNSNSTPLKHQGIKLEKIEFINTSSVGSDYESSSNPVCPSPCSNASNSPRPEHSDPSVQIPSTTSSSQQQPEDEDTVFGQSIAAELRRITNRRKKLKLKSDIFRMICDVESE